MPELSYIPATVNVAQRLAGKAFDAQDCRDALRGKSLPRNLGNDVVRLCTVHGIRQHAHFAHMSAVAELCAYEGQAVFARARNARLIMSNEVPGEFMGEESYPYCIWYPELATEKTYKELVKIHPDMRYQVGRACAVAGYAQLYRELELLPDTSIAEEARENRDNPGAQEIFKEIMAATVRYKVMDDYTRTVNLKNPEPGAQLNADTAVRANLVARRDFREGFHAWRYINITEDWGISERNVRIKPSELSDDEVALLDGPLPFDLPTMTKDLLILVAAYTGNVDRYARLRRRFSIDKEFHCLVRGIYHSTFMATWLDRTPEVISAVARHPKDVAMLRRAINARRIMNNDIFHIIGFTADDNPGVPDDELPYWIWYPTIPSQRTLMDLAKHKPSTRPQCVRACIAAGYHRAYSAIMDASDGKSPPPDYFMMKEAQATGDRFFEDDLLRRKEELGLEYFDNPDNKDWKHAIPWRDAEPSATELCGVLLDNSIMVHSGEPGGIYEDLGIGIGKVELYLSVPKEVRHDARATQYGSVFLEGHRDEL